MPKITLDNITEKSLDKLRDLYKDRKGFRVNDDRARISFGKRKEYFLIRYLDPTFAGIEFTFIWIGKNLWQFTYLNKGCTTKSRWVDPEKLLATLLNNTFQ